MTLEAICICTVTRMLHGCPRHAPGEAATPQSTHAMLIRLIEQQEVIMTALDDLKAADQELKDTVTTFLADISTRLTGAASDADIESVVQDINAEVDALKAADPGAPASAPAPAGGDAGGTDAGSASSDGSTGDSGTAPADGSAPAEGTAGSTVPVGGDDTGSAS